MVYLEIARVHHHTQRRPDRYAHCVRYAVAHPEELRLELPQLHGVSRLNHLQPGIAKGSVFPEFHLNQSLGQPRGEYGNVQLRQDVWQSAGVVFVAVGNQDSLDALAVLGEVGDVGDDEVHPQHVLLGEQNPGVDDDNVAIVLQGHHVPAYFAEAAQWDDS